MATEYTLTGTLVEMHNVRQLQARVVQLGHAALNDTTGRFWRAVAAEHGLDVATQLYEIVESDDGKTLTVHHRGPLPPPDPKAGE